MPRLDIQNLNYSLGFNGSSSAVKVSSGSTTINQTFTIAAWVKCSALPPGNFGHILYVANGVEAFFYNTNGNLIVGAYGSGSFGPIVNFNQWCHVVVTRNGTGTNGLSVYVNGVYYGSQTRSDTNSGSAYYIGDANGSKYLNGDIANAMLWNRVLSPQEITSLYQIGAYNGTSLVGYWPLQEGAGTTAHDISGNNNTGTISNGKWSTDVPSINRSGVSSSPRVGVQNFPCSLLLGTTSSKVSIGTAIMPLMQSAYTMALRVKVVAPVTSSSVGNMLSSAGNDKLWLNVQSGQGAIRVYHSDLFPTATTSGPTNIQDGNWHHVAATYTGSVISIYLDGNLIKSISVTGTLAFSGVSFDIGQGNTSALIAKYLDVKVFNRALSSSEVISLLNGFIPPGIVGYWPLTEGSQSTAYDTSGNGNNGTITNGTYTSDVPMKQRSLVGGNLVYNGNFEFTPPVNTALVNNGGWLDGTGAFQTANKLFGWTCANHVGSTSVIFDTVSPINGVCSVKLSTTAASSLVQVYNADANAAGVNEISSFFYIHVLPNTSYTLNYKMKTQLHSGAATTGALIKVSERNGSNTEVTNHNSITGVLTTTGATQYSYQFTTLSNTNGVILELSITGNDGTGTLIMDAWFDDITLVQTTPPQRTGVV